MTKQETLHLATVINSTDHIIVKQEDHDYIP